MKVTQVRRERILKKLAATISLLKTLPDKNFNYAKYVEKFDMKPDIKSCGTIACVAGWYPTWFPRVNLTYINNRLHVKKTTLFEEDVQTVLERYHEFGWNGEGTDTSEYGRDLTRSLFYGHCFLGPDDSIKDAIEYMPDVQEDATVFYKTSRKDVLKRFQKAYKLIEAGKIDYALNPRK